MKRYKIKENYLFNLLPTHHNDISYTDGSQNEVYEFCKKLLDENGFESVIDVGCGSGYKLIKFFDDKNTIGIETEPCISFLRENYPQKKWIQSGEPSKSLISSDLSADIVICSDVIEHMIDPDTLIQFIQSLNYQYLIISTPDRAVLKNFGGYENSDLGPPINSSHVREWSYEEFESYLSEKFQIVGGHHCEIQSECMFFVCKKKSIYKPKIHISTCMFGKETSDLSKEMPEQLSDNFDISFSFYNDYNFYTNNNYLDSRMKGKIPKMLEWLYVDADYYVWIDYPIEIITNEFHKILEELDDCDICLFNHKERDTIKEEAQYVIEQIDNGHEYLLSRYDKKSLQNQIKKYSEDANFVDDELFNMGFFIYSKRIVENKVDNVMKEWFFHNTIFSLQDQISFPYLLKKYNLRYKIFRNGDVYNNDYTFYNWNKHIY